MLEILKRDFMKTCPPHPGLHWSDVEARPRERPKALETLRQMEDTGGKPDTIGNADDHEKLIFRERRYGAVFPFHNGADPCCSVRGWRGHLIAE